MTDLGLRCQEQPDEWGHWVVFDGKESTLNFSVEDGAAIFATFDMASSDPSEFLSRVEQFFTDAGWITGPE
jgi:hypothetical protein